MLNSTDLYLLPAIISILVFAALLIILALCCSYNKQIKKLAFTDSITEGMSYNKFKLEAETLLRSGKRRNYALVLSDIDNFSYINDAFGYSIGDEYLMSVSKLVCDSLNPGELCTRRDNDNFLYLLEYEDDQTLMKRLSSLQRACNERSNIRRRSYTLFMKRGIYIIPKDETDFYTIIRKAEHAHKISKKDHLINVSFYDNKLHQDQLHEKALENSIASSLENNQFIVYLQPKVCLKTSEIIGAEALIRWQHPTEGLLAPDRFIPMFESNGFIIDLDFYVYRKVCQLLRHWLDDAMRIIPISVNVSRLHVANKAFASSFNAIVEAYKIPPNLLELEITENIFLKNTADVLTMIGDLKKMGFKLSLDDFGCGYSSLNLLKELPVDILKLDKGFFKPEGLTAKDKSVVSGIINIAKDLELQVLSEGIETAEQAEFLNQSHCDMAQGYLFAKPMPIDQFELLLQKPTPDSNAEPDLEEA